VPAKVSSALPGSPSSPRRLLWFALLGTLFSAFGQTFFIGLFSAPWRDAFGLGNAGIGGLYSSATLISGLLIVQVGRWLDHVPLPRYTLAVVLGFATGCLLVAVAPAAWVLLPGLLLLRLCGQGLMGHIAMTTTARHFVAGRGRALAVAQLGFPIGEACFPLLVVAGLTWLPWRALWALAALALLALLPLLLWLCRALPPAPDDGASASGHASRREVLRDPRFYALLPVVLAAPFIITGLFFHQGAIAAALDWPLGLLATAFIAFAGCQVASALLTGVLIDRVGARRLMRFYLLPMALACALLWRGGHAGLAFAYMGLLGVSAGANSTLTGALWAELYGTRHLGAIRAMQHALMVLSTAASPVLLGLGMDRGIEPRTLALALGAYALLAGPLLGGAARRERHTTAP
jgi:MFS family permease